MERDINLIIISDDNNKESRELAEQIPNNLSMNCSCIPVQRVQHILPGIRATPAVGVLVWASDLQGLATDVGSFADYIHDESTNKQALADSIEIAQAYVDLAVQTAALELGLEVN